MLERLRREMYAAVTFAFHSTCGSNYNKHKYEGMREKSSPKLRKIFEDCGCSFVRLFVCVCKERRYHLLTVNTSFSRATVLSVRMHIVVRRFVAVLGGFARRITSVAIKRNLNNI